MRRIPFLLTIALLFPFPGSHAAEPGIPILLDTDIGTDIDDAFALALIVQSPELDLVAVTTVSGDTQARARLAAKMLWEAGRANVPVAAAWGVFVWKEFRGAGVETQRLLALMFLFFIAGLTSIALAPMLST